MGVINLIMRGEHIFPMTESQNRPAGSYSLRENIYGPSISGERRNSSILICNKALRGSSVRDRTSKGSVACIYKFASKMLVRNTIKPMSFFIRHVLQRGYLFFPSCLVNYGGEIKEPKRKSNNFFKKSNNLARRELVCGGRVFVRVIGRHVYVGVDPLADNGDTSLSGLHIQRYNPGADGSIWLSLGTMHPGVVANRPCTSLKFYGALKREFNSKS
ncbi:hypothetical protein YC2023_053680 [Brassica napus]